MRALLWSLVFVLGVGSVLNAAEPPRVERFLQAGKLADGERELTNYLKAHPTDDQVRFGLGTLQFVRGIEHLSQSLYQYGAVGNKTNLGRQFPLFRLPVPENPTPEKVRYADVRRLLQNLIDDLAKAEATLAQVKDPDVKLPLRFGLIRLDVDGNGRTEEHELLWKMYAAINRGARLSAEPTADQAASFVIAFDAGDVHWLRGYCHLLSALCEYSLAYEWQPMFNAIAHQIFANPEAPTLPNEMFTENDHFMNGIADGIAAIHLIHFPVKEPKRCEVARLHLVAVIEQSRLSWRAIQVETDNDHEWVPNPKQTGVIPGVTVTDEMIAGWHEFLDEAEQILDGKRLLPHWRLKSEYGINLHKVFAEPREFDLVLWFHGAGAIPYVEEGVCTKAETWDRFQRIFRGEFIGFALWFN